MKKPYSGYHVIYTGLLWWHLLGTIQHALRCQSTKRFNLHSAQSRFHQARIAATAPPNRATCLSIEPNFRWNAKRMYKLVRQNTIYSIFSNHRDLQWLSQTGQYLNLARAMLYRLDIPNNTRSQTPGAQPVKPHCQAHCTNFTTSYLGHGRGAGVPLGSREKCSHRTRLVQCRQNTQHQPVDGKQKNQAIWFKHVKNLWYVGHDI